VRRGCSFHGLALNVAVDLAPFAGINPCGYAGLEMTRLADLGGPGSVARVAGDMKPHLLRAFGYPQPAGGRAGSG
jgi:lipoyl(octanoyl) transferase